MELMATRKIPVDQRKADMDDPAQHAGWAVSSIPPPEGNDEMPALVLPVLYLPILSEHLWRCGFRHHPELQEIEQDVDDSAVLSNAGVAWVKKGERPDDAAPEIDLTNMSDDDVAALERALARRKR